MANFINLTSKKVSTSTEEVDGKQVQKNLYLCSTTCGKKYFTNEPIGSGTAVVLEERKAGTKYFKDGIEKFIQKDGWNFEGIIGRSADIKEIQATKVALVEAFS